MIHFLIGTKAQFIKTAPVMRELDRRGYSYRFVDTGQHAEFTAAIRPAFGIRAPDVRLTDDEKDVASMSRGILWMLEHGKNILFRPRWIKREVFGGHGGVCVIHGDTVSTLIGALLARRAGLAIAHLEAGLRSYNYLNPFPEELIRVWCMRLATLLFVPDEIAMGNINKTRTAARCVATNGNTVLDAIRLQEAAKVASDRLPRSYVLATCHRLETLKSRRRLTALVRALNEVAQKYSVVFVLHKPTETALRKHGLLDELAAGIERLPMQPYFDFIALARDANFVMADGGSIQEECAALGVPLLIMRSHTERPDGLGENARIVGFDFHVTQRFLDDVERLRRPSRSPEMSPSNVVAESLIEHDK
ncbi:MAG: UDP-N-acetylglucosamine 2-epimerase [Pirellulales bacterium]|nr:UDP-N-acetylglucosamine 2-epimerase [Pirellulales bacterium]